MSRSAKLAIWRCVICRAFILPLRTIFFFRSYYTLFAHKEIFVITDNAPIHKSDSFLEFLPGWGEKGLNVVFLSTYSPELNLIEILWRKMKYEWLPFSAYTSFQKLTECVEKILVNLGSQYKYLIHDPQQFLQKRKTASLNFS